MKYVVKWNNGFWKVFDSEKYEDVQLCKLKTEAETVAARLNKSK